MSSSRALILVYSATIPGSLTFGVHALFDARSASAVRGPHIVHRQTADIDAIEMLPLCRRRGARSVKAATTELSSSEGSYYSKHDDSCQKRSAA